MLAGHRPAAWVSDRYAGQQDLAAAHQVCLAHVLRDVQYAIDCGDAVFAPRLRDLLRWAIAVGRRRSTLQDSTLAPYRARADRRLDALLARPVATLAGPHLQAAVKAWRSKFFLFLEDREVPATNNVCEREIRPSVVFRKVTGGFRSDWGAEIHAGHRSVTSTAKLNGQSDLQAVITLLTGTFTPQPAPAPWQCQEGEQLRGRSWLGPKSSCAEPAPLPGLACLGMIECTATRDGTTRTTRHYHLSSRPLTATTYLAAARSHWSIENGRHWVIEMTFDEERARNRKDNAPENLDTPINWRFFGGLKR